MQPFDTALTRVYNQPTERKPDGRGGFRTVGLLYRNPIDCLWKTASTEGIRGLYKGERRACPVSQSAFSNRMTTGSTAHLLRIAPHTIVTLTANVSDRLTDACDQPNSLVGINHRSLSED